MSFQRWNSAQNHNHPGDVDHNLPISGTITILLLQEGYFVQDVSSLKIHCFLITSASTYTFFLGMPCFHPCFIRIIYSSILISELSSYVEIVTMPYTSVGSFYWMAVINLNFNHFNSLWSFKIKMDIPDYNQIICYIFMIMYGF